MRIRLFFVVWVDIVELSLEKLMMLCLEVVILLVVVLRVCKVKKLVRKSWLL